MSKIIVDIETAGFDFETFDKKQQEYLLKYSETEEKKASVKKMLAIYPFTGEVIAIGLLNPETMKGTVLFQDKNSGTPKLEERNIVYETGNETEILEKFCD